MADCVDRLHSVFDRCDKGTTMPTPMRRVSFKRAERLEYGVSDQARVRASSRSAVATHIISDGYENEYEGAGLITNLKFQQALNAFVLACHALALKSRCRLLSTRRSAEAARRPVVVSRSVW